MSILFYANGFFVRVDGGVSHNETVFYAFKEIRIIVFENTTGGISFHTKGYRKVIQMTAANCGKTPKQMRDWYDQIERHWMEYHQKQPADPLFELTTAVQHLPATVVAGEVYQEAESAFKKRARTE